MKNSSEAENAPRSSQTYILITAFMALFAIVGFALYGLPFFYDFMTKEYGWSRAIVTSGNAVGKLLVAPLFGFFAGWLIDRYGPRSLMMTGAFFTGTALIGLSFADSLPMFYLFYVFNALGYVFGGPLPCQVLISRWFDKNRGKAMGIAYLGIGTGGALVPLISAGLEKNLGWHLALAGLGVLVILIAVPMAFFIKDSKKEQQIKTQSEPMVPIKTILRNPNFYLLALGSMCSIGAVGGIMQHIKLYLRDLDFTQSEAAQVMSFVLFASLAGRVLMGFLADLINRKYVMILIYLIVASAIPLLLLPEFTGRIYIFAVIFGIGLGGDYMIIPLMAGDLFGVRALGRTMGIILVADGIAEASFPMLVGGLYDASKSYTNGFLVLIGLATLGAVIVSFLPKTKQIA
ncbi:MAG: MFS transporter [Bacteroidota bacterium]|nr:MFS transporter [Odoribacter sp.]MDP3642497.1 MFS transporter [Bacteroidota bacterium]